MYIIHIYTYTYIYIYIYIYVYTCMCVYTYMTYNFCIDSSLIIRSVLLIIAHIVFENLPYPDFQDI